MFFIFNSILRVLFFFFFQAEDGIRDLYVTGVQTCALPILAELLGPFDVVRVCLHGPGDGCGCRKPAPGLVLDAAAELGVPVERCVVIGDIGADVEAAAAAGARGILVPNGGTRPEEVRAAAEVAADVPAAVEIALSGSLR